MKYDVKLPRPESWYYYCIYHGKILRVEQINTKLSFDFEA